jgi:DNA-binding beta-propeller fold protein YncE
VSNSGIRAAGAGTVSVIDTSNMVVTTLPPVGQFPKGLVATPTNVYVAPCGLRRRLSIYGPRVPERARRQRAPKSTARGTVSVVRIYVPESAR